MVFLITDLDDTLVPQTESPIGDRYLIDFNRIWTNELVSERSLLVYNTGRSITLFYQLVHQKSLLLPDYLICGVGTEIYRFLPDSKMEKLQQWTDFISQDFFLEYIRQVTERWVSSGLVRLQSETENSAVKQSFYFDPQQLDIIQTKVVADVEASLCSTSPVKVIVSVQHGVGHLDIIPAKANKGTAAMWLREYLGVVPESTVVCGDSMNDYDMFFCSVPIYRIAVGNCEENIRREFLKVSSLDPHFYLASKCFAGGILEGLCHFAFVGDVGWDSY